jgi:hypothetical protein
MKRSISLLAILAFSIFYLLSFRIPEPQIKFEGTKELKPDTISFRLKRNFTGDCGDDCYSFIGSDVIIKVNHKAIGSLCNHLFIKCPSSLRLQKNIEYLFVAKLFVPPNCSTIIDTCEMNKIYVLIKKLK